MIEIDVGYFLKRRLIYFYKDNDILNYKNSNVLILNSINDVSNFSHIKTVKTYITNIESLKHVGILESMNSTTRNSVHYCENNGVEFEIYNGDFHDSILKNFFEWYRFYIRKFMFLKLWIHTTNIFFCWSP